MSIICGPNQLPGTFVLTDQKWLCTVGSLLGYTPTWFNSEADLPAGRYRIKYIYGAMRYSQNHGWSVSGSSSRFKVVVRQGTVRELFAAPASPDILGPSQPNNNYPNQGFDTQEAAENWSRTSASIDFDHTGGPLGLVLVDNPYNDNIPGNPNPTWELTRLEQCQIPCTNGILTDDIRIISGFNRPVGQVDPHVRWFGGPVSGPISTPLAANDFTSAKNGALAFVIDSYKDWATVPSSKWVGTSPTGNLGWQTQSALYAVTFEVTKSFEYGELTIDFVVDDQVGGGPNQGIFINGVAVSGNSVINPIPGSFNRINRLTRNDVARDLVVGLNTIYFNVNNAYGGPTGISFDIKLKLYDKCSGVTPDPTVPDPTPLPAPSEESTGISSYVSSEPTATSSSVSSAPQECVKETPQTGLLSPYYKNLLDVVPESLGGFGFIFKPGTYITQENSVDSIMTGEITFESTSIDITCRDEQVDDVMRHVIKFGASDALMESLCIKAKGGKGPRGLKGAKGASGKHGTGDGPKGLDGLPGKDAITPRVLTGVIVEESEEIHDTAIVQLSLDPATCTLEVIKSKIDVPDDDTPAERVRATPIIRDVSFTGDMAPYTLGSDGVPAIDFGPWQLTAGLGDPASTPDLSIMRLPDGWTGLSDAAPVSTVKLSSLIDKIVQQHSDIAKRIITDWERQSKEYTEKKDKEARIILADLAYELAQSEWSSPIQFAVDINPVIAAPIPDSYYQARLLDTGILKNVWLLADDVPAGTDDYVFLNPEDDKCYYIDRNDTTSENPGHIIVGWQHLDDPSAIDSICNPFFRQAKSCLTNALVDLYYPESDISSYPLYFVYNTDRYYIDSNHPRTRTPGPLATNVTEVGGCDDPVAICDAESFVWDTGAIEEAPNPPAGAIMVSPSILFDPPNNSTQLQISYSLDDIAFLIKASDDITVSYDSGTNYLNFVLPSACLMFPQTDGNLSQGPQPNWSNKRFTQGATEVIVSDPGTSDTSVILTNAGLPTLPVGGRLTQADLISAGLYSGTGSVSLKYVFIISGMGHFTVTSTTCLGTIEFTGYDTGEDATGTNDNRWQMETSNGSGAYTAAKIIAPGYPWISPLSGNGYIGINTGGDPFNGIRSFKTTINITDGAGSGSLSAFVAVDNTINDILVNGVSTGLNGGSYGEKMLFNIPGTYFTAGNNVVTFKVDDSGGLAGLLVEWVN